MPLRFTLRQLEYLVAVGESGSIAMASEKVNVSSPSISAAISQLEQEFGLPLFVRKHAHGLSLTQGGKQFVEQAKVVLAHAARLNNLANDITGKVRGPLHVGCLLTFAQVVLPHLRRGFVDMNPEVDFHQFERNQSEIFEGLRNATLDLALSYDLNIPPDLEFVPLTSLPPYAVLHDTHELAHLTAVSPAELAEYPMVLLDLPMSAEYFLSFFSEIGVKPRIAERTRDMAVMQSLVGQGFGYSIANIRPHSNHAPDGRKLRYVPLTGPVRPMELGLVLSEGARASQTVRAFVDHCQAQLTPENTPGLRLRLSDTDTGV
ncbi:LysR family transcriptional regulator [Gemmobacter fulvus]|uniref:LysR family transcriptional regulator n=1 Tax=Gemmobacter fulvus TaxID=2840474 RepID=A0A975S100_9RHOB|nr:LysR family transcriptional regulator [Gemmobacter fulvus]MBT9244967.1 LysR family transcriptional regulator [Gemmobacter fulvus]QWK90679.1 LysR family transcriptional regulator [Gemmobacter fulvus]